MLLMSTTSELFITNTIRIINIMELISITYKDALVTRNGPTINRARRVGRSVLVLFQALRYPVACSTRPNPLYLSFASRREAGEVEDASQPEPPQGQ